MEFYGPSFNRASSSWGTFPDAVMYNGQTRVWQWSALFAAGRGEKVFSLVEVEKGARLRQLQRNHFQEQIFDDIAGIWKIKATRAQRETEGSTIEGRRARQTRRVHLSSRLYLGHVLQVECNESGQHTRRGQVNGRVITTYRERHSTESDIRSQIMVGYATSWSR